MKIRRWFGLLLLGCCCACATKVPPPQEIKPQPTASAAVEKETPPDKGENECSYFYFLWGQTAESEQHFDEALEAYEKAVACEDDNDYVMRHLVLLLMKMDKKVQAVEWLEKIIARHPQDLKVKAWLGNLYEAMDDRAMALKVYQEIMAVDPNNVDVQLRLASLYANSLEYEKARTILEKVVAGDPTSFVAHYYLAKLYRALHFDDKALSAYERAMALKWTVPLALEAADLYEKAEKPGVAVTIYKRILGDDPGNEQAGGRLARLYLVQKEVDKALALLEDLRNYAAEPQEVDYSIGRILLEQHRLNEAIVLFSRLLADDPEQDVARYFLAYAQYEKGEVAKAQKLLREIKDSSEAYEDAILLQARILREKKDAPTAIKFLLDAVANDKTAKMSFYATLAGLYLEQQQVAEGDAIFQKAFGVFPGRVELIFEYALFLDRAGNAEAALASMERVLLIKPDDPFALNYVGYSWAEKGENLPEAQEYIEKAVALRPEDGFIRDSLGWLFYIKGDAERAVAELEKALLLEPNDPTINEHMGDAYRLAVEKEKALAAYRKAQELYKDEAKKAEVTRKLEELEKEPVGHGKKKGKQGCH